MENIQGTKVMRGKIAKDVEVSFMGGKFTVPAGTAVKLIDGPQPKFAVESVRDTVAITGNAYDAKYRYLFVPTEAVEIRA